MLRHFSNIISTVALLAALAAPLTLAGGSSGELCALPTASLESAMTQYADSAFALDEIKKHAIASWYTDRNGVEASQAIVRDITKHCDQNSRMTLVVYGLPNKDCDAGYSSGGFNKNADDYKKWIQTLVDGVGQRKVLYVLEPDAVGLMAKGGCGASSGYEANVKVALEMLTKNPNADVYLDVGYWTLSSESDASGIAKAIKALANAGRLKGISLNTSNYRSNKQISELCGNFQKAYGDNSLHCIVDTSRNYNENPPSNEWCNAKFGGIGRPPTSSTGFDNLDYFIWIKPAGESDGTCDGGDRTPDAMKGPAAGSFFKDHFVQLWNNGYYVKEKNMPAIDGTVRPTSSPSSSTPAPAVTQAPDATTPKPQNGQNQNTEQPSNEAGEITTAPAPTPKKKRCRSRKYAQPTEAPTNAPTEAPTDAPAKVRAIDTDGNESKVQIESKSVSFSASDNEGRAAPEVPVNGADGATTRENGLAATGVPGGVIAAIVVAGVMAIAVGAIAMRHRREKLRAPRPSADTFGQVSLTPAGIHVL